MNSIEDDSSIDRKTEKIRYDSLDILRGLSMFLLLINHSFIYLGKSSENDSLSTFLLSDGFTLIFSASTFLTVSGISNGISHLNREKNNNPQSFYFYFIRGIILIILAIYISWIGGSITKTSEYFNFDVLYLFGLLSLMLPLFTSFNNSSLISFSILIIICTPLIRRQNDFLIPWGGIENNELISNLTGINLWAHPKGEYHWNKNFKSIFEGAMFKGYFSIFPYSCFFLIGIYFSRHFLNENFELKFFQYNLFGFFLIILSFFFAIIGGKIPYSVENSHSWYGTPFIYFPTSFSHLLCQMGSTIIILNIFHKIFDKKFYQNLFLNGIRLTGKFSLTIYVFSLTIIYSTIFIIHLINKKPVDQLYNNLLPGFFPLIYGLICWIFLILIYLPICLKYNGIGTLEHLIVLLQNLKKNKLENEIIKCSIL